MNVQKNVVTLKDSWLMNMIDVKQDTFYKVSIGPDATGSIKPNVHD